MLQCYVMLYLQTAIKCRNITAIAFPSLPRRALLERGLVTWQVIGVRHIFEDIVGRVIQYMDEPCLGDEWHLGNMTALTAQPALKFCSCIMELSEYLKGRREVIMCLNKSLPILLHLVKSLYAARQQMSDRTAALAPSSCACNGHEL